MSDFRTPNFRGQHALILHRASDGTGRLARQLERLGMSVEICWPDFPTGGDYADVIFFDADNGFDGLFPWAPGSSLMPLIALLGSELPGRIEWAMSQSFSAHVMKPIQSSGVFSALVIAYSNFEAARQTRRQFDSLNARIEGRPAIIRAVVALMRSRGIDENAAYACIRSAAMVRRMTVEDFCSSLDISGTGDLVDNAPTSKRRQTGE